MATQVSKKQSKSFWSKLFVCGGDSDSATSPSMVSPKDFASAVKDRRSIYAIDKNVKISDKKLQDIVEFAVKWCPSSFNSQSGRAVLLLGKHHDKFWELTTEILRKIVKPEQWSDTEAKMKGFAAGYGTVLFFEDQTAIKKLQEQFPTYAEAFPQFSLNSSGMLQYVVWTAFEAEGLGCSLQHYSPLVDEAVQKEWNIPSSWQLVSQMPFGNVVQPAGPKEFQPLEERVKIHKSG